MKKALVTGAGGQDGYFMSEYLINQGYEVVGIVHSHSSNDPIDNRVRIRELDIRNYDKVYDLIRDEKPDEIYNFAAQSSSIGSWENTRETNELNYMVPVSILESIRDNAPSCRFFQASSAEIFGKDPVNTPQDETTMIQPSTPYATAKAAAGLLIKNYREKYGIFAINGIFYNHESVRRKDSFLSTKIVKTVANIKLGTEDCLYVGNINSKRDWGYAPDYMEAAYQVMQLNESDDYIFSTGIFHTVRQMIEIAFMSVNMPVIWEGNGLEEIGRVSETGRVVVRIDEKYYRDYDRNNSLGNPQKLMSAIGWKPKTSFEDMIQYMTDYFVKKGACNV